MKTARVIVSMLNGDKHDVVGIYMALGDRIEYEHTFGRSIFDKGKVVEQPDGTGTAELDLRRVDETSRLWFVWKMLGRAEVPVGPWEEFYPQLEALDGPEFLEGPLDPTDEDQQPTSSPS